MCFRFIHLVVCIRISFTFVLNRISFEFVNLPGTAFIHRWTHGFFPSHHRHSFCQHIWTNASESFSVFGHKPGSNPVGMHGRYDETFEKIIVFHAYCSAYNHNPQPRLCPWLTYCMLCGNWNSLWWDMPSFLVLSTTLPTILYVFNIFLYINHLCSLEIILGNKISRNISK